MFLQKTNVHVGAQTAAVHFSQFAFLYSSVRTAWVVFLLGAELIVAASMAIQRDVHLEDVLEAPDLCRAVARCLQLTRQPGSKLLCRRRLRLWRIWAEGERVEKQRIQALLSKRAGKQALAAPSRKPNVGTPDPRANAGGRVIALDTQAASGEIVRTRGPSLLFASGTAACNGACRVPDTWKCTISRQRISAVWLSIPRK